MSVYEPVLVYSNTGEFLGYTIKRRDVIKLQTTNLYGDHEQTELNEQLARLNGEVNMRQYWPHPQDPEVVALLEDKNFCPIEYVDHAVIDDDHTFYAYLNPDDPPEEREVDELATVYSYKTIQAPKNPSDQMVRIKTASEQIARQRAYAAGLQV